ncbi:MAG TPA: HPr family phosphocarrier protein [bacterium]|nr:HPr family phosphocarrier protein [bacterium]
MNEGIIEKIKIVNKLGLHARAAAKFVKMAVLYKSQVSLGNDTDTVDGKSIMDILLLAAENGSQVTLHVAGEDQAEAFASLKALIEGGFGE